MKETKLAKITPFACSKGQPDRLNLRQNGFSILAGLE